MLPSSRASSIELLRRTFRYKMNFSTIIIISKVHVEIVRARVDIFGYTGDEKKRKRRISSGIRVDNFQLYILLSRPPFGDPVKKDGKLSPAVSSEYLPAVSIRNSHFFHFDEKIFLNARIRWQNGAF